MRKGGLTTLILVVLAIAAALFFYKRYHVPPAVELPKIALTDLQGHKVTLDSYSGHPLFISFFATWCGPCMRELPELAALKARLAEKKLQVICVSDEPMEKLQRIQARIGNEVVILHSEVSLHDINIYTYPTNYIYDASGKKIYEHVNPDNWADPALLQHITQLLN